MVLGLRCDSYLYVDSRRLCVIRRTVNDSDSHKSISSSLDYLFLRIEMNPKGDSMLLMVWPFDNNISLLMIWLPSKKFDNCLTT